MSGSIARVQAVLLAGLFVLSWPALAAPELDIADIHPGARAELPPGTAVYARIRYDSDRPLRIWLAPYRSGQRVTENVISSASPVFPAGRGEALAWFEFREPVHIDEIRAHGDAEGRPGQARQAVNLRWRVGAPPPAGPPAWVAELRRAANAHAAAHRNAGGGGGGAGAGMLVTLLFLTVPLAVALQIAAWRKLAGGYGSLAKGSAVALAALWLFVIVTGMMGSNLSPIWLVFLSPVFVVFLLGLFLMQRLTESRAA